MSDVEDYRVDFLLVHPDGYDYRTLLRDALESVYDEETDPEERRVQERYTRPCADERRVLTSVSVLFSGPEEEAETAISTVTDVLAEAAAGSSDPLLHAVKFSDALLLAQNQRQSKSLFEIEMQIREGLTLAFLSEHVEPYDLLNAADVQAKPNGAPQGKRKAAKYGDALENELFYLDYSGYRQTLNRKEAAPNFLIRCVQTSRDFAEFKRLLEEEPIRGKPFDTIVGLLKGPLKDVAPVRNAVAHYRTATPDEIKKYGAQRAGIEESLREFYDDLSRRPGGAAEGSP